MRGHLWSSLFYGSCPTWALALLFLRLFLSFLSQEHTFSLHYNHQINFRQSFQVVFIDHLTTVGNLSPLLQLAPFTFWLRIVAHRGEPTTIELVEALIKTVSRFSTRFTHTAYHALLTITKTCSDFGKETSKFNYKYFDLKTTNIKNFYTGTWFPLEKDNTCREANMNKEINKKVKEWKNEFIMKEYKEIQK